MRSLFSVVTVLCCSLLFLAGCGNPIDIPPDGKKPPVEIQKHRLSISVPNTTFKVHLEVKGVISEIIEFSASSLSVSRSIEQGKYYSLTLIGKDGFVNQYSKNIFIEKKNFIPERSDGSIKGRMDKDIGHDFANAKEVPVFTDNTSCTQVNVDGVVLSKGTNFNPRVEWSNSINQWWLRNFKLGHGEYSLDKTKISFEGQIQTMYVKAFGEIHLLPKDMKKISISREILWDDEDLTTEIIYYRCYERSS